MADIQATIQKRGEEPRYYNCVQKIHKIASNLCVAFSGDIRSGLKIIEVLKDHLSQNIKENEYFDIDGQSAILTGLLRDYYNQINPKKTKPVVEFMFLWNAQEGENTLYRPFCMKFKSPDFHINSTAVPGLAQTGSGMQNGTFQAITSFLSGRMSDTAEYQRLFAGIEGAPTLITVENFKNIIMQEAAQVSTPGISKSFISFESVIPYNEMYDEEHHKEIKELQITLGLGAREVKTANHHAFLSSFSIKDVQHRLAEMATHQPHLFQSVINILQKSRNSVNLQPLTELPPVTYDWHISADEEVYTPLIHSWPGLKAFLGERGIRVEGIQAIA
ncbi:hypothetical protein [Salmonella enterica]|uniref:hypothetical protein n=1 Tax=Salmonella enterica TaxID=28901 RepID=UPI00386A0ED9